MNKNVKNNKWSIINRKSHRGFTLNELLVVIVVLLVVGSILISVLISSLRGTNKVSSLDNVRTRGNYALEQMSKMIRYSQSCGGVSVDGTEGTFTTDCRPQPAVPPDPPPAPIEYHYIKINGFDKGTTIFSCVGEDIGASEIASYSGSFTNDPVNLIDISAVTITTCKIYCSQETVVSPPTVTIQFDLRNFASIGHVVNEEQVNSIPFQSAVTVRNY